MIEAGIYTLALLLMIAAPLFFLAMLGAAIYYAAKSDLKDSENERKELEIEEQWLRARRRPDALPRKDGAQ